MIVPNAPLAAQLHDNCDSCKTDNEPVVLDGHSDQPFVAFKCSCGNTWVTQFERSYVKKTSTPSLAEVINPSFPEMSGQPICKGCSSPMGQPHASSCPFV